MLVGRRSGRLTPPRNRRANDIDVDAFGRVFFPDLGPFPIDVLDTNNKAFTTSGHDGNEDSGGALATVKSAPFRSGGPSTSPSPTAGLTAPTPSTAGSSA